MPKNLVIVESPAKARTIERYLGADYRVLASYGHVRDLPENPGKGKFGVDVDHDFAPEYVIADDRRKQVDDIEQGGQDARTRSSSPRTSTAKARPSPGTSPRRPTSPRDKTRRVTFSEITEPAIREAFAHPREIDMDLVDAQQTRRIVDRLVGYTLSPLLSRKVRGGLSAGRVQSVAVRLVVEREREITGLHGARVLDARGAPRDRGRGAFAAEVVRIDGEALDIADEATADAPRRGASRELAPGRHEGRTPDAEAHARAALHDLDAPAGGEPEARLQPEADDVGRPAPVRGRRHRRTATSASSPTCEPTRRPSPAWRWARPARSSPRASARPYTMPKGRVYKTKTKGAQEAHESIRPTSFGRDPDALAAYLKPEELRLYRLIWQRALASQMAPKELETTTVELADGRYELRATATKDLFDGFAARLHRGPRRRAAETRTEGSCRPLAEGDRTTVADVDADPALHRAAAALHRGDAHQGARGARHRPARRRTRRRSRRSSTAATSGSRSGGCGPSPWRDRDRPAGRALRRLRRRRVHGAHGGGARRGRPRRARLGPAAARVLRPAARPRRREAPRARARGLHDRGDRRGLLAGPPDGHPARPERPVPGLLAVPRAQGDAGRCPATSRRPSRGPARPAPSAARARSSASAAGSGRSWAARATRTATTSRRTARRRPSRCRSRSTCPKNGDGHLVPRRARRTGNVFWGCSRYPNCDFTTNYEPLGGLHDADDGPVARKGDDGDLPGLRRARSRRPPDAIVPGERYPGGPPNPAALARPARARRRARAAEPPRAGGRGREPRGPAGATRPRDASGGPGRSSRPPTRERGRGATGDRPALARFLRTLAARDASPHTQRAYATAVGAYLDWLGERGADWRTPGPADLRAYLARLGDGPMPARRSRSGSRPSARSIAGPRATASRRAIRGARSRRRACRAACRASWRSSRSSRCSPSSTMSSSSGRATDPRPGRRSARARAARPGHRRDGLRGGPAHQRACRGRPGRARPAAGRAAGAGQGPQGARRAPRAAGPGARSPPTSRTAGRRCSSVAGRRAAPPVEIFLNHLGEPLGVRGLRYRLDRLCARAGLPGRRLAAHAPPLVRDPPARRRRGPAGRPGAARPREPGHHPDLHARLAGAAPGGLPGGPPAGASRRRRRERGRLARPRRPRRLRRVPRLARPGLRPGRRHRQRVRPRPSSTPSSRPSGSRTSSSSWSPRGPVLGPHPVVSAPVHDQRASSAPGGSCRRSST